MLSSVSRRAWVAATVIALVAVAVVLGVGRGSAPGVRAAAPTTGDTVSVVGAGTASGAPDTLAADFTVHVTRATVQEALDAQAGAARGVLAALQRSGVARKDVQTTDLELNRHYDNHGTATGFDASETLRARITPLAHAGRTISAAATAAGSHVDVGGMSFDIADDQSLLASARANAFADAKQRAQQYATLAGRSLGAVQRVSERVQAPPPTGVYGDALFAHRAVAAPVPLRAGRQTLTVHVMVVWSLA